MNLEQWSQVATIIAGISTFILMWIACRYTTMLTKYSAVQNDRKIIEDIFLIQRHAESVFTRDADFSDIKAMIELTKAREMARLYDLNHIELYLQKLIDLVGDGYELHRKIWNRDGMPLSNHTAADMDRYHNMVRTMYDYLSDISCYKKYLRIESV